MEDFSNKTYQITITDFSQLKPINNEKQKVLNIQDQARLILESCGFVRDPSRPTFDM